jgi:hypothetical protein
MKFETKSGSEKLDQNQKCKKMAKKMKKREKLERGWIHAKLVQLAIDAEFSKNEKMTRNYHICAKCVG